MVVEELNKGPEQLKNEVIAGGWCVSCGACVELCPYIKAVKDRVAVVHSCGLNSGHCYAVCPRTFTDYNKLAPDYENSQTDGAIGSYMSITQARATEQKIKELGQYGGVVSALLIESMGNNEAKEVLLTDYDGIYPRWLIGRNSEDILSSAGSKYAVCPGLSGLNQALRKDIEQIDIVGRPCQVVALRKMINYSEVEGREKVGLIIGLFCFWGLDYSIYDYLKQEYNITRIDKADIPKDAGLTVSTDQGTITLSLEETRSFIRSGCYSCVDSTSELADISVGSTELDPKWCTVIVRTKKGEDVLNKAIDSGLIETKPYPDELKTALSESALNKKKRVLGNETDDEGPAINSSYLKITESAARLIGMEG